MVKVFNTWTHGLDLTLIISTKPISITDFITGLLSLVVFSVVVGIIFTLVYNSIQRKEG